MQRRQFLQAITSSAIAAACGCGDAVHQQRKPNIVLIVADDLGYGHLGCYGQRHIRTPNIDQLAAGGQRFTDAYSGCTVCAPSRSALMTGQHTGHTPVRSNSGGVPLPAGSVTIAEVLRPAGYVTGAFGKWGLGGAGTEGVPTRQGFDEFLGPLHQVHAQYYYPDHLWRNEEVFPLPNNSYGDHGDYVPDVIHRASLDFIRRNREQPFFLYFPSMIPHHEFQAPPETLAEYEGRFPEEPFIREDRGFVPQPHPAAHFAGMVTRLDQHVGQIMDLLAELSLDQDTLVLFASDNGPIGDTAPITSAFDGAGPLRGFKRDLYEGGIRVPLIAHWTGRIPAGSISNHPCAFWDFLPTFAELAGSKPPQDQTIDGISIVPALLGEEAAGHAQEKHQYLYWESGQRGNLRQAVRMGNWKAVRYGEDEPLQLYDLSQDLGEQHDRAADAPDVVAKIESYLETCRNDPPTPIEPGWDKSNPAA